jgi:fructuronate reductase
MRYVLGRDDAGQPIDVRDPLAERFATIAAAQTDANEIAEEFLRIPEIFGGDLADHPRFASTVAGQLRELLEHGAARTVQSYLDGCGAP